MCPNDLLRKLPFKTLGQKPLPPSGAVDKMVECLPIKPDSKTDCKIVGSGDWTGSISSDHSVSVACDDIVVKIPMGELKRDSSKLTKERFEVSKLYDDIAPPTMIIVATDENGRSKPVVIQQRIHGKPACETSFKQLLRRDTLIEIKRVYLKAYDVFEQTGLCDFAGQRFSSKIVAQFLGLHPFLSDNIMISDDGKVFLVDNIPDCYAHNYSQDISKRKFLRNFRLRIMLKSIDFLIAIQFLKKQDSNISAPNSLPIPNQTRKIASSFHSSQ